MNIFHVKQDYETNSIETKNVKQHSLSSPKGQHLLTTKNENTALQSPG